MHDPRSVLISVAHSAPSGGARGSSNVAPRLEEYMVSLRASLSCFRNLAGHCAVELYDVGNVLSSGEYLREKVSRVNQCKPSLAIEIHCNGSTNQRANYSEVIHYDGGVVSAQASTFIAAAITRDFARHHPLWGRCIARPNTVERDRDLFYFLEKTQPPTLIVEGVFITNEEQHDWLATGGCEAYGAAVADGIKAWLENTKPKAMLG